MAPPLSLPHIEDVPKRVRVLFAGKFIVDSTTPKFVWEHPYFPMYYFQAQDLSEKYLKPVSGNVFDLVVEGKTSPRAVTKFTSKDGDLDGLIKINFASVDSWYEEDEEIFVHPKDPYKRCDVLQSSRHIRVEVNGTTVAETTKPRILYETLLHPRTYIPKTDVKWELLQRSDLETKCPYKGTASYYNVKTPSGPLANDVVWWYPTPLEGVLPIKGYVCFYDEYVDVFIDGVKQERPKGRR